MVLNLKCHVFLKIEQIFKDFILYSYILKNKCVEFIKTHTNELNKCLINVDYCVLIKLTLNN